MIGNNGVTTGYNVAEILTWVSFNPSSEYLLNTLDTYYMPSIVLGMTDTSGSKIFKGPILLVPTF